MELFWYNNLWYRSLASLRVSLDTSPGLADCRCTSLHLSPSHQRRLNRPLNGSQPTAFEMWPHMVLNPLRTHATYVGVAVFRVSRALWVLWWFKQSKDQRQTKPFKLKSIIMLVFPMWGRFPQQIGTPLIQYKREHLLLLASPQIKSICRKMQDYLFW